MDHYAAPDYTIENASWRDLSALRRLEAACFGADAWPLIDLLAVLTFRHIVRLKAVAGTEMIAFIAGDPHPAENMGWITTLGVLPAYRRKGVARTLLLECEARMNLPRVRLSVRADNFAAIRLYCNEGYHERGVWVRYYKNGEDALVMEKMRENVGKKCTDEEPEYTITTG